MANKAMVRVVKEEGIVKEVSQVRSDHLWEVFLVGASSMVMYV
jgi:hypothetical protein